MIGLLATWAHAATGGADTSVQQKGTLGQTDTLHKEYSWFVTIDHVFARRAAKIQHRNNRLSNKVVWL